MKDLYEILEVSPKASEEVIEKAYKVLAKKYHPDLQTLSQEKLACEKKMKEINEAYEILGNKEKRKQYDEKRKIETRQAQKEQEVQKQTVKRPAKKQEAESIYDIYNREKHYEEQLKQEAIRQKKMNDRAQSAYEYAYEKYLKSLGFKVKKKWTWRRVKDFLKAIAIMTAIILALWIFPPTKNWMISFYEENIIVKALVDFIVHFFQALGARIAQ